MMNYFCVLIVVDYTISVTGMTVKKVIFIPRQNVILEI